MRPSAAARESAVSGVVATVVAEPVGVDACAADEAAPTCETPPDDGAAMPWTAPPAVGAIVVDVGTVTERLELPEPGLVPTRPPPRLGPREREYASPPHIETGDGVDAIGRPNRVTWMFAVRGMSYLPIGKIAVPELSAEALARTCPDGLTICAVELDGMFVTVIESLLVR